MKKLLFVMESLRIGGAEKSLLTLLSELDYDRFDVSLFLFRHDGELMQFLPSQVKLLPEDPHYRVFAQNWKTAPLQYLRQWDILRVWYSFCYVLGCVWQRVTHRPLYIGWNFVRHLFGRQTFDADVAIAYLERKCVYFTAERIQAPRKVAFIHNNYNIYPYDRKLDTHYFADFHIIATVAEYCRQVLAERFPQYADRFVVVKNMVSVSMVQRMAQQQLPVRVDTAGSLVLVTVGRLVEQKGYDRAVRICKMLVEQNVPVKWYAVGDGSARAELRNQIEALGLQQHFFLVGSVINPYAWMQLADVYVQPSRFEGCSTTVAEAKALNKKIVCSNIPEFAEQLQTYPNAWLAETEAELAQTIQTAVQSPVQPYTGVEDTPDAFYRCIGE